MKTALFRRAAVTIGGVAVVAASTVGTAGASVTPNATGGGCGASFKGARVCIGADATGSVYANATYPKSKTASCRAMIEIYKNDKLYKKFTQRDCEAGIIGVDTASGQHGTFYAVLWLGKPCSAPCVDLIPSSPDIKG